MYRDTTHSHRELNRHRAEEIAWLRRVGGDRSPVRMVMGSWLITVGQRLVAPRAETGPAPMGSGV